jgi:transcriptional regulator with XRE-family HTH domain
MSKVHIGKLIRERLEEIGMSKSEFSRRINTSPQNVYGIFKRKSIDTELLQQISEVLKFDFFSYYGQHALVTHDSVSGYGDPERKAAKADPQDPCRKVQEQADKEISYLKRIIELLEQKLQDRNMESKAS